MSLYNRRLPMSQRLFNMPMEGGPSPKHLLQMLKYLCLTTNKDFPSDIGTDQNSLANYLKNNFASDSIDDAHNACVEMYKNKNVRPTPPSIDTINQEFDKPDKRLLNPPSDIDEKYVLRVDYDNDVKAQAEILFDFEKKIKGQQKAIEHAITTGQEAYNYARESNLTLDNRIRQLEVKAPTVVHIQHPELEPIDIGVTHKQFPLLVSAANARLRDGTRLNLWLYGPAGTGKTYAANLLSKVLFGNEYRSITWTDEVAREFTVRFKQNWEGYDYNGSLSTQFQVFGYMDANGKYVSTAFRRMWEFGGVYLFDEIDGSMPDALLALQGALSGDYASFPDGLVKRHPDCVILAGANTTGLGGGIEYIGAMKQNSAFLNRWVWVDWPHDNGLEDALCADKSWVRRVRHVREGLARESIRSHLITMRQSLQGEALLAAGIDKATVEKMTLRGSLNDAQWERVSR